LQWDTIFATEAIDRKVEIAMLLIAGSLPNKLAQQEADWISDALTSFFCFFPVFSSPDETGEVCFPVSLSLRGEKLETSRLGWWII
jgi:hypothetical protein